MSEKYMLVLPATVILQMVYTAVTDYTPISAISAPFLGGALRDGKLILLSVQLCDGNHVQTL